MSRQFSKQGRNKRLVVSSLSSALLLVCLCSCQTTSPTDVTGSLGDTDVLSQAHSPEDPDWRILSVQGAVLDQQGKFEEARQYYASALRIVPDEPSVLSNLGLSYVLSKELGKAEEVLRKAYSHAGNDRRIRMNLAVVLGLEGHMAEAESIAKANLPVEEANADVAELKRLLARKDTRGAGADRLPVATIARTN